MPLGFSLTKCQLFLLMMLLPLLLELPDIQELSKPNISHNFNMKELVKPLLGTLEMVGKLPTMIILDIAL